MNRFVPLLAGLIFGIGLAVADMTNPAKVLNFLDLTGQWDPSLALVMGGGLAIMGLTRLVQMRRGNTVVHDGVLPPAATTAPLIDARLVVGSALFGMGWGLAGICPGPALADLATGSMRILTFVAAMLGGMALFRLGFERRQVFTFQPLSPTSADGAEGADG